MIGSEKQFRKERLKATTIGKIKDFSHARAAGTFVLLAAGDTVNARLTKIIDIRIHTKIL